MFAKTNGGAIIVDNAADRALAQSTANIPWSQHALKGYRCLKISRGAHRAKLTFFRMRGECHWDSMWRNEYEILMENPNITGINYWVVMPDGSVVLTP